MGTNAVWAQIPGAFLWATGGGGSGPARAAAVACDAAGNLFVAGHFSGTATFGTTTLTSSGGDNFFVARYDSTGELSWVRQGGDGGSGEARASGVAIDAAGNVWLSGSFTGTLNVGGTVLASAGLEDGFVAKYDPAGGLNWVRRFGGSGPDQAKAVASGPDGAVALAGFFNGNLSVAGAELVSSGTNDIIVVKYDGFGNAVWARKAGGALNDEAGAVGIDRAGNVCVGGQFNGTALFEGNAVEVVAPVNGTTDLFLAKYSSQGTLAWVRRAGGVSSESVQGLALDGVGNVFVTGRFFYTAWFGDVSVTTAGGGWPEDFYVAKYSPAGDPLWVRSGGGTGVDTGLGVGVDMGGNAYVGGRFSGVANFGGKSLTSSGAEDTFVAAYSAAGNLLWATRGGGTGTDLIEGVTADGRGQVFVAGSFGAPGAAFGTETLSTAATTDYFAGKLLAVDAALPPVITVQPADQTVVDGADAVMSAGFTGGDLRFQWWFNGAPLGGRTNAVLEVKPAMPSAAGDYRLVITNDHGAVTSAVAKLTVSLVPIITRQPTGYLAFLGTNLTLSVGAVSGVSGLPLRYYWTFNGTPLAGQTSQALALTNMQYSQFGSYAVIVSNRHGAVTSATALVSAELTPEVLWTLRVGGSGDDQALAVAVTETNVYAAGLFSGTVQIGTSNLVSSGLSDVWLARYGTNGVLRWARKAGGTLVDAPRAMAADKEGNIYVAGSFQSRIASFGEVSVTNVNNDTQDLFVAKYDSAGNALWARRAGSMLFDQANAVAVDGAGNAYITGSYYDAATFGNVGLTNRNYTNFFLAKYDPEGNVVWARTASGSNSCHGSGIGLDAATNVYVTGVFMGWVDFGSGSMTNTNTFFNGTVFVSRYDQNGNLEWARKGAGTGIGQGQGVAADDAGNFYGTSYKRDYGLGYLVSKYRETGQLLWFRTNAISCCTGDATFANGLLVDGLGNAVVTGGGSGVIQGLTNYMNSSGYLLKYRSDGAGLWIQRCGVMGNGVAKDAAGNLYVAGRFAGTTFFGASSNLVSSGGNDAFLVKFGVRPPAITSAPFSRVVSVGSEVLLVAVGSGTGPLGYQWQFNGVNIPGALGSSLRLETFQPGQDGSYTVVIQNTGGAVTSRVAVVTFVPVLESAGSEEGLTLNWQGNFTLQSSTNAAGPYLDIPAAKSGHMLPWEATTPRRFYRLRSEALQ